MLSLKSYISCFFFIYDRVLECILYVLCCSLELAIWIVSIASLLASTQGAAYLQKSYDSYTTVSVTPPYSSVKTATSYSSGSYYDTAAPSYTTESYYAVKAPSYPVPEYYPAAAPSYSATQYAKAGPSYQHAVYRRNTPAYTTAAPAYYTEAPKYYTTYAAPAYYTEAPQNYVQR